MNDIKNMVKKSASSFFWSMRLLPKAKRLAIYTIYVFCRHLDDIISGNMSVAEKSEIMTAWREEMDNIFDKKVPATDIGRKIYKNCMRFKLPKSEFLELISSMSMDLSNPLAAPNLQDFYRYCRGVGGVPVNLSLRVFGCESESVIESLSLHLGNAIQMTNILRDVKEDADAGRVYIPKMFLEKAGITSFEPLHVVVDKNLVVAREELAKIARKEFEKAYELLLMLDKKTAKPVKVIINMYKKYFDLMDARGWEIISPKPKLSRFHRFKIVFKAFMMG